MNINILHLLLNNQGESVVILYCTYLCLLGANQGWRPEHLSLVPLKLEGGAPRQSVSILFNVKLFLVCSCWCHVFRMYRLGKVVRCV